MRNLFICFLFAMAACSGEKVLACDFLVPTKTVFSPAPATEVQLPPAKPLVSVARIVRGGGDLRKDSCSEMGVITITIPESGESEPLVYSFSVVAGKLDNLIFYHGFLKGHARDGKMTFVFPWIDGNEGMQEPLAQLVRVTPYRMSGVAGPAAEIWVTDPGR